MVKWQVNIWYVSHKLNKFIVISSHFTSRRRPRSARYYQVFGHEPEYPCWIIFLQCVVGGLKCFICYGFIYLLLKWYVWPIFAPTIMRYTLVQTTLNRPSSLLDRLRPNRKLPFE